MLGESNKPKVKAVLWVQATGGLQLSFFTPGKIVGDGGLRSRGLESRACFHILNLR